MTTDQPKTTVSESLLPVILEGDRYRFYQAEFANSRVCNSGGIQAELERPFL